MRVITCFLSILLIIALAGCLSAVPYAKKGTRFYAGGYEDRQLGSNHYAIEVEGNGFTSYELAEQYFHRRAQELCARTKYRHEWKRTTIEGPITGIHTVTGAPFRHVFPVVVGEVWCEN